MSGRTEPTVGTIGNVSTLLRHRTMSGTFKMASTLTINLVPTGALPG